MDAVSITSGASMVDAVSRDLDKLRETAGKVVGSVFYGTMLKAMRDSSFKGAYGHGGRGEDVFGAQLHALYAERLGTSTNRGLQDALYRTLEKQQRAMSKAAIERTQGRDSAPGAIQSAAAATNGVLNVNA